jgi:hypothetical protein
MMEFDSHDAGLFTGFIVANLVAGSVIAGQGASGHSAATFCRPPSTTSRRCQSAAFNKALSEARATADRLSTVLIAKGWL